MVTPAAELTFVDVLGSAVGVDPTIVVLVAVTVAVAVDWLVARVTVGDGDIAAVAGGLVAVGVGAIVAVRVSGFAVSVAVGTLVAVGGRVTVADGTLVAVGDSAVGVALGVGTGAHPQDSMVIPITQAPNMSIRHRLFIDSHPGLSGIELKRIIEEFCLDGEVTGNINHCLKALIAVT